MGDVALVPERDVLETDDARSPRTTRARPQIRSAMIGLRLCGIADEPFWPRAERLLDLAHLRAREMPDLGREAIERRRDERERGEQLGVAVALEDLRRARRRLEPETLARDPLDLRVVAAYLPTAPDSLPTRRPVSACSSRARSRSRAERPAGELEAERRRLRMDAMGASDAERLAVLLGAGDDRAERPVDPVEHERPRLLHRQRERGVEDVRGREAEMEPPPVRAEVSATASTNAATSWFVSRSISATRSGEGGRATDRIRSTASAGTTPSSAQPSRAASSTSSIRESLASSDQIRAMAGRA